MKSVALHNLGCKVNSYELDGIQQMLQEKGYKIVPFDEIADIDIINTCTVTNSADRKSRQMLHRAKKQNPAAVVVAVGCYVQTGMETVEQDEAIDLAIGNNKKKELIPILEEYLREREENCEFKDKTLGNTTVPDLSSPVAYEEMQLKRTADHTRAYIKIQDGCNQFCSYCIIPFARGRVRSRQPSDVVSEAAALVKTGYQEVVLTGIHISSYGIDLEGADLLSLIRQLHEIEGLKRIRLGSLEPRIITREFAEGLRALPKVCPHFHLSLQSGCDDTLKRMNRHYLASEYYEKVKLLRQIYDMPAITTDVIVGFPGETEEEFEITRTFLEKVDFYEMHVFKYSKRQGTNAAKMKDQVKDEIKTQRSNILLSLEREQSHRFREHFIGRTVEVLMEEPAVIDGRKYMTGHTKEYVKVALETTEDLSNRIITGRAEGFVGESMLIMNRQG